jgi:hypothetical protein
MDNSESRVVSAFLENQVKMKILYSSRGFLSEGSFCSIKAREGSLSLWLKVLNLINLRDVLSGGCESRLLMNVLGRFSEAFYDFNSKMDLNERLCILDSEYRSTLFLGVLYNLCEEGDF